MSIEPMDQDFENQWGEENKPEDIVNDDALPSNGSAAKPEDSEHIQSVQIKNFSKIRADQSSRSFRSDIWVAGGHKWRLLVFPRGCSSVNHLAIFVEAVEAAKMYAGVTLKCQLTTVNQANATKSVTQEFEATLGPHASDRGFQQVCLLSDLPQFLGQDDTLYVQVKQSFPSSRVSTFRREIYDSRKETGFVGLKNQGATCYMNSLLQNLFHISFLRKAVYQIPVADTAHKGTSIPWQLQRLFYELQTSPHGVSTKGLTKSFGWSDMDAFRQHDVQELCRVLFDKLEEKFKGTSVDGTIQKLFEGATQSFIECTKVQCESKRTETFQDLSLVVKGCPNLYKSFEQYIEVEEMVAPNQYRTDKFGLQDARKGVRFIKFPNVLQLHLRRFEYDPMHDATVKINDRFEFPVDLDLTPFLADVEETDRVSLPKYTLHSVFVHLGGHNGGHYYAYVRPDPKKNQWYKFDDETVTKATEKDAVENNFGGPQPSQFPQYGNYANNARPHNAYMLVYVRSSDVGELLPEVKDVDIPTDLVEGVKIEDKDRKEREEAKRREALLTTVDVYLEADLKATNMDKPDLAAAKPRTFQIEKSKTLRDLRELIAAEIGIPAEKQCFWEMKQRNSKNAPVHIRPALVEAIDYDAVKFASLEVYAQGRFWHQYGSKTSFLLTEQENSNFLTEVVPQVSLKSDLFLMFKYFDIATQTMSYVGSSIVKKSATLESLIPLMHSFVQDRVPADAPLLIHEEWADHKDHDVTETFDKLKLINGDIIMFCAPPPEAELAVFKQKFIEKSEAEDKANLEEVIKKHTELVAIPEKEKDEKEVLAKKPIWPAKIPFVQSGAEYLRFQENRVCVNFKKRDGDIRDQFMIELNRNDNPREAITRCSAVLQVAADRLRLHQMNDRGQYLVDRFFDIRDDTHILENKMPCRDEFVYHLLELSVTMLETHMPIHIHFYNQELDMTTHRPIMPRKALIKDTFPVLIEKLKLEGIVVPDNAQFRVILTTELTHLQRVVDPETTLVDQIFGDETIGGGLQHTDYIRYDLVSEDEVQIPAGHQLVWFVNYLSESMYSHRFHGVPFFMPLSEQDTAATLREKLAKRLKKSLDAIRRFRITTAPSKKYNYGAAKPEVLPEDKPLLSFKLNNDSSFPSIGLERPVEDKSNRRVVQNHGITINEAKD